MIGMIIRLGVFLLIGWVVMQIISIARKTEAPKRRDHTEAEELHQDPVCGTFIPASQAVQIHQGDRILFFCSAGCREKFLQQNREK